MKYLVAFVYSLIGLSVFGQDFAPVLKQPLTTNNTAVAVAYVKSNAVVAVSAANHTVFTNETLWAGTTNSTDNSTVQPYGSKYIIIGTDYRSGNSNTIGGSIILPQNSGIFSASINGYDGFYFNNHHDGAGRGRPTISGSGGLDLLWDGTLQLGSHSVNNGIIEVVENGIPDLTHFRVPTKNFIWYPLSLSNNLAVSAQPGIVAYCQDTNGYFGLLNFYTRVPIWNTTGTHEPDIAGIMAFQVISNGLLVPANNSVVMSNANLHFAGALNSGIEFVQSVDPNAVSRFKLQQNGSGDLVLVDNTLGKNLLWFVIGGELDVSYQVNAPIELYGSAVNVNSAFTTKSTAQLNLGVKSSGGKPNAVTLGASPYTFINNTPNNLECYMDDIAAYSVSKNGTTIYASLVGDKYFILQPTNSIVITYLTTTPTLFTNSW